MNIGEKIKQRRKELGLSAEKNSAENWRFSCHNL